MDKVKALEEKDEEKEGEEGEGDEGEEEGEEEPPPPPETPSYLLSEDSHDEYCHAHDGRKGIER